MWKHIPSGKLYHSNHVKARDILRLFWFLKLISDILQLKLYTAPVFIHFPAKGKPSTADKMDIQRFGVEAEAIARWIAERTDIQVLLPLHSRINASSFYPIITYC